MGDTTWVRFFNHAVLNLQSPACHWMAFLAQPVETLEDAGAGSLGFTLVTPVRLRIALLVGQCVALYTCSCNEMSACLVNPSPHLGEACRILSRGFVNSIRSLETFFGKLFGPFVLSYLTIWCCFVASPILPHCRSLLSRPPSTLSRLTYCFHCFPKIHAIHRAIQLAERNSARQLARKHSRSRFSGVVLFCV